MRKINAISAKMNALEEKVNILIPKKYHNDAFIWPSIPHRDDNPIYPSSGVEWLVFFTRTLIDSVNKLCKLDRSNCI